MTGPEHFREAEAELMPDGGCEYACPHTGCVHEIAHLARAQVHATLALAAATALGSQHMGAYDSDAWQQAAAGGIPDISADGPR
jgi:hypothetical protein